MLSRDALSFGWSRKARATASASVSVWPASQPASCPWGAGKRAGAGPAASAGSGCPAGAIFRAASGAAFSGGEGCGGSGAPESAGGRIRWSSPSRQQYRSWWHPHAALSNRRPRSFRPTRSPPVVVARVNKVKPSGLRRPPGFTFRAADREAIPKRFLFQTAHFPQICRRRPTESLPAIPGVLVVSGMRNPVFKDYGWWTKDPSACRTTTAMS
jgi:hypothetical protein